MLTTSAMRTEHISTAPTASGTARRACPCCARLSHGRARKLRRTQRRRENTAFRNRDTTND
jgi:hypothetical protein